MKTLFLFLALYVSVLFGMNFQPFQLSSGFTTIDPTTYHAFHLDLGCAPTSSGTLTVNVNNPYFLNPVAGVYIYCSNGPAEGQYSPWPSPQDNTTYQYTTDDGINGPLPSFTIKNAGGVDLYCIVDSPDATFGSYTLVAEFDFNSKTDSKLIGSNHSPQKMDRKRKPHTIVIIQKPLFYSNKAILDVEIDYLNYTQVQLPLCVSSIIASFGPTSNVCLHATVIGESTQDISYHFFSVESSPNPHVTKWATRPTDDNPFADYSGRSRVFINRFISEPVVVQNLPQILYHTIYAQGGSGSLPPFPNRFSVAYMINQYCP